MGFGDSLHQGQPESPPLLAAGLGIHDSPIRRKESLLVLRRDGHPFIVDFDYGVITLAGELDFNGPMRSSVFDGIAAEILQDAPKPVGAPMTLQFFRCIQNKAISFSTTGLISNGKRSPALIRLASKRSRII